MLTDFLPGPDRPAELHLAKKQSGHVFSSGQRAAPAAVTGPVGIQRLASSQLVSWNTGASLFLVAEGLLLFKKTVKSANLHLNVKLSHIISIHGLSQAYESSPSPPPSARHHIPSHCHLQGDQITFLLEIMFLLSNLVCIYARISTYDCYHLAVTAGGANQCEIAASCSYPLTFSPPLLCLTVKRLRFPWATATNVTRR